MGYCSMCGVTIDCGDTAGCGVLCNEACDDCTCICASDTVLFTVTKDEQGRQRVTYLGKRMPPARYTSDAKVRLCCKELSRQALAELFNSVHPRTVASPSHLADELISDSATGTLDDLVSQYSLSMSDD